MLTVQEVRSVAELVPLEDEWDALLQSAPNASFFLSPSWLISWLQAFWSERAIRFLLVREEGRLAAIAPFVEDAGGDLGCRRSLSFPVNAHSHVCDVLAGAGSAAAALPALLSHLGARRSRFRLTLRHLESSSLLARTLPQVASGLGLSTQVRRRTEWALARLGPDWAAYLQSRDPHVRSELRRQRKKIERAGRLHVRSHSTPAECRLAFQDVLQVESRSWKDGSRTSLATEARVTGFYRSLADRCAAKGQARIYVLHLDGRPVAHLLGVEFGQAYLALKTSYDEEYAKFSPGKALLLHALEDCQQRGLEVFDFLGEVCRWKLELASETRTHVDLCVFSRRNAACRACQFGERRVKPLVRRWLPAAARSLRSAGRMLTAEKG